MIALEIRAGLAQPQRLYARKKETRSRLRADSDRVRAKTAVDHRRGHRGGDCCCGRALVAPQVGSANGGAAAGPRAGFVLADEKAVFATYAGSQSCRECHATEFGKWESSHHGLAERKPAAELDRAAFDPVKTIRHGTQTSEAKVAGNDYVVETTGFEGRREGYRVERVIGHDPLRAVFGEWSGRPRPDSGSFVGSASQRMV